ncbi:type 2 isopentenyl-diphosphate Delta-isomerase [Sedimentibacter sp. zth1]|uniref:type 2 isopentenyl-diphosphate Delta-isomerase n=1 Tax=Sedimentibacter sp. zth1 TaxID=2816908 RepID=UPI001A91FC97|nr:type 2 isopentenyl-diphosphate Delta-isomerase [Sedimentibacter sp. zth1]QSX07095.1 type 2 isopentenyl-diphosphate Delta-isomerase [Sedimentibacter sp. zth1]
MDNNLIRSKRKLDHIKYALKESNNNTKTGLDDIVLIHKALPKYNLQDIEINTTFLGKKISAPIFINAMTGGHKDVLKINEILGRVSRDADIPIAVGSQKAGVEDKNLFETYSIVRKINPEGVVIGNLSANCSLEDAKIAVEMIEADALQLHLNVAQEISMKEGDTTFENIRENIINLKEGINVPVIVKEVGCGMSLETIKELMSMDIKYIDISGAGGTNFIDIEYSRHSKVIDNSLINWGIPTAYSMVEANIAGLNGFIVSGGIKNSFDIAKCLSMGAKMVGISGEILKQYFKNVNINDWIEELKSNLKKIMLLTNSSCISELTICDKVIKGELLEWQNIRK